MEDQLEGPKEQSTCQLITSRAISRVIAQLEAPCKRIRAQSSRAPLPSYQQQGCRGCFRRADLRQMTPGCQAVVRAA